MKILAIRREEKSPWERRAPLTPDNVRTLVKEHGLQVLLQPSPIRIFADEEYRDAGADIREDLSGADLIIGVKEVPLAELRDGQAYLCFSHTIKAQPYNMPLLGRMMDLRCTLIDHEKITDDTGRRLVLFGYHAGLAGMLDSLWALGQRLAVEGYETALAALKPAHSYTSLADAERALAAVGADLHARGGLPPELGPVVIGITGYGNVSRGAQHICQTLGRAAQTAFANIDLGDKGELSADLTPGKLYQVVFREEHMVAPRGDEAFDLDTYFQHPEGYRSIFEPHLAHLTCLVNCIYWESRYPRLVTFEALKRLGYSDGGASSAKPATPRLRVIGDISCDIEGSIAATVKATQPDDPVYVIDPHTREATMGVRGPGPVIMAVDNLPCELPREASQAFGEALAPLLAACNGTSLAVDYDALGLPDPIKRAIIVHRGQLAPEFAYLADHAVRG